MNDQHDDRQRGGEPQWPTGEDPDGGGRREAPNQPRPGTPPGGFARPQGGTPPGGFPQQPPRRPVGPGGPGGPGGPVQRPQTPPGGMQRPMPPGGPLPPPPPGGRPPGPPNPNGMQSGPAGPRRPGPPPPRRQPGDERTDLLPPVQQVPQREPDLLTHREPDEVPTGLYEDDEYYDDEPELSEEEEARLRKKKIWRRVRRAGYVTLALMIFGPIVAVAIAYPLVNWPRPEDVAAEQNKTITVYYANGEEMTKIVENGQSRTMLQKGEVPLDVEHAILAAEDAGFRENPGFDAKAIARAAWIQATGGTSGGSGLTQQYIKKATGKEEATYTRKFTEVVKAFKMSNESDHDTILTAYLNTVYFGRGANGIVAAAQAYYGKPLKDLSASEAALIAGLIQTPSYSEDKEYAQKRWTFVMDQMLQKGWIDQAYRDAQQFPTPKAVAETRPKSVEGPRGLIVDQIEKALEAEKTGITYEDAQKIGVKIHTTIDPAMQIAAEQAVDEIMIQGKQPEALKTSLTAIEPSTGAVRAYWGGRDGRGSFDYATGTLQEAGSSFKPFDLVAALKMGKGLGDTYDGTSPRKIGDVTIRNSNNNNSCGKQCTIRRAMELSLNTVFFDMVVNDLGTPAVKQAAHDAGIPDTANVGNGPEKLLVGANGGRPNETIALGGGDARVRPFDMAAAYATFAARGVKRDPFFITKITAADDVPLYTHSDKPVPAFDPDPAKSQDISDNVTEALKPIPKTSNIACAKGRECAGKTGTHELPDSVDQNSKAWMVGYTPSLSTSVWVGRNEGNVALKDKGGNPVFGSGLPGKIWQKFMDKALAQAPMERFPKAKPLGKFEDPKPPSSSTPSSKPNDDSNSSKPTQPSRPTETTTTTRAKPGNGCPIVGCPTSTTDTPDPGTAINGRDPNEN